jgi:glyoxylase-like metal-dependent hydrolase (beta-lactamase superfamily II)
LIFAAALLLGAERPDQIAYQCMQHGTLPREWPAGRDDYGADFQIHAYDDDTFILRQAGHTHYEKPFLYLLFGEERAILFDTGAGNVHLRAAVDGVIDRWLSARHRSSIELVVAHTHAHSDHIAGDAEFVRRSETRVVAPSLDAVVDFFDFHDWPNQNARFDLGGRALDLIPVPGHEKTSIAFYDEATSILLTGDFLYAGRLYVDDAPAFRASVARLVDFTRTRRIVHILGSHIENSRTPFIDYPVGTKHQPEEHSLELGRAHLLELHDALEQMNEITRLRLRDFTIWPV